nr:DeoR/GlpR family DNA-binding transcription regulator [Maliibacterium massiliense]
MLQIERLQTIEKLLEEQGSISIAELEQVLGTSRATIYRDLKTLHNQDKVHFTRGGVTRPMYSKSYEQPYYVKRATNEEEKRRIAEAATEFIKPNSTIFMDSSTTVTEMNKWLCQMQNIRVITNDVMLAAGLSTASGIEVFVLGGQLRPGFYTLTGLFAHDNLAAMQIDTAFVSCDAINLKSGCMITNAEEVSLKTEVIDASAETIMLCDHQKFETSAFMSFCPIDKVTHLIVGKELDQAVYQSYLDAGVDISCV